LIPVIHTSGFEVYASGTSPT